MASRLSEIFQDQELIHRIQERLPVMFYIAEIESSRAGRIGMEVGSLRESILISMLIYKFGEENIETEISITEPEVDVIISGEPISIKSKTGHGFGGIKVSWTVDAEKALQFLDHYEPTCDILLAQIIWEEEGGLFFVPIEAQLEILGSMGKGDYLNLPKPGTNPRGIEIHREALTEAVHHPLSNTIPIMWKRPKFGYQKYQRWVTYWRND